jgi:hypothetical protein
LAAAAGKHVFPNKQLILHRNCSRFGPRTRFLRQGMSQCHGHHALIVVVVVVTIVVVLTRQS